jgi:hypothetical protein
MTDPVDGVVFDNTYDLYDPIGITDYWAYFFEPIRRRNTLVVFDLPSYGNAEISVTISGGTGETVSLGALVVGRQYDYSKEVRLGASVGIQDYSRKERDTWGNTIIVERPYAKRTSWSFLLRNADLDDFIANMADLRAKPAVYVGSKRFSSTVIYGFFKDFDTVIAYPSHSECSVEIEGLT